MLAEYAPKYVCALDSRSVATICMVGSSTSVICYYMYGWIEYECDILSMVVPANPCRTSRFTHGMIYTVCCPTPPHIPHHRYADFMPLGSMGDDGSGVTLGKSVGAGLGQMDR
jgi:hypothetical protein